MAIRNIVVGIDFSDSSNRALDQAVFLAKSSGAKLHLVHAYRLPIQVESMYGISIPADLGLSIRDAAARKLEKSRARVADSGLEADCHLIDSGAAEAVVAAAEKIGADLIAVGTRGLTGIKHVLMGSVAERVAHTAHCSVLVVRDDA